MHVRECSTAQTSASNLWLLALRHTAVCRHAIERLLGKVDAVVYLLDATKLKTQEELDLISKLRCLDPPLFSRLASRLFFVVTKIDSVRPLRSGTVVPAGQTWAQSLCSPSIGHRTHWRRTGSSVLMCQFSCKHGRVHACH